MTLGLIGATFGRARLVAALVADQHLDRRKAPPGRALVQTQVLQRAGHDPAQQPLVQPAPALLLIPLVADDLAQRVGEQPAEQDAPRLRVAVESRLQVLGRPLMPRLGRHQRVAVDHRPAQDHLQLAPDVVGNRRLVARALAAA